jgi:hypothetical protein
MPESAHSANETVENKSAAGAFFPGKGRPAFFPEGVVQRKCAACEAEGQEEKKEKKIQRQAAGSDPQPYVNFGPAETLPPFGFLPDYPAALFANATTAAAAGNGLSGNFPTLPGASDRQSGRSTHMSPVKLSISFKLQVNQLDDPYEREADAAAEKVVQRRAAPVGLSGSGVQRKCAHCEAEEKRIQKKGAGGDGKDAGATLETDLANSQGKGAPLPDKVNAEMSAAFGVDLSGVSIHTDGMSARMNKDLNAHAFTHGNDIYFNSGKYDPESSTGKFLLAHELTHVIQQNGGIGRMVQRMCPACAGGEKRIQRKIDYSLLDDPDYVVDPPNDLLQEVSGVFHTLVQDGQIGQGVSKYLILHDFILILYDDKMQVEMEYEADKPGDIDVTGLWAGRPFVERGWHPVRQRADKTYHVRGFDTDVLDKETSRGTQRGKDWDALNQAMTVVAWLDAQGQQDLRSRIRDDEIVGMLIMKPTPSKGGKDGKGGKTGKDGPHLSFILPPWFAELKKNLDKKLADEKKAHPEDPFLPDSLLYYGSEEAQAQRGSDAWTIEIKKTREGDVNKDFLTVKKGEWDAQPDKGAYADNLLEQIKTKVAGLNKKLQTKAFDQKTKKDDKAMSAKDSGFAWALALKDKVWKQLTDIRAKDKTAADIPDRLTLQTEGEGETGKAYLSIWVQNQTQDPNAFKGATLAKPLNRSDDVDDLVQMVRTVTTTLKSGAPPPKFSDPNADPNSLPGDVGPAYPAHIYPKDLSQDLNTIPSAENSFRFVLDVSSPFGRNELNEVTIHMNMMVRHWWYVYDLPPELALLRSGPQGTIRRLISASNDFALDKKSDPGKEIKSYGPDWDWDESISMSDFKKGDYLLMGIAQPIFNDPSYKRAASKAAYPFTVADPDDLANANVNSETDEIERLKAELAQHPDDKDLQDRLKMLTGRQEMDEIQFSQALIGDQNKLEASVNRLHDFILDDRQHHLPYAGDARTNSFRKRLNDLDPALLAAYDMIRREFYAYDDLTAIALYKEGLAKQKELLSGLYRRALDAPEHFETGSPIFRTVVTLVQEETGNAIPVVMEMGKSLKHGKKELRYTLLDLTFESPDKSAMLYVGDAVKIKDPDGKPSAEEQRAAVKNAFEEFGGYNHYGDGMIRYRVPGLHNITGETASTPPLSLQIAHAVMIAGMLALIIGTAGLAAPEVAGVATVLGIGSGIAGAVFAGIHIHDRYEKGTLDFDAQTGMDILMIIGGLVAGGQVVKAAAEGAEGLTGISKLGALAVALKPLQGGKVILAFHVVNTAANGILINAKVQEDIEAIKGLSISDEKKAALIKEVEDEAVQQGAMLFIGSIGLAHEVAAGLVEKVAGARYKSLPERGFLDDSGQISKYAPPSMKEAIEGSLGEAHGLELAENNRVEAAVMGMADAPTVDEQHKITVTKKGKIIRCSDRCLEIRMRYAELIAQDQGKPGSLDERLLEIENMAREAAQKDDNALAKRADDLAVAIENQMARAEVAGDGAPSTAKASIPEPFLKVRGLDYQLKQMRAGGATEEQIQGILENAVKQGVEDPDAFVDNLRALMERRKNSGKTNDNTYKILDGLQSNDQAIFKAARGLMKVSGTNVSQEYAKKPMKYFSFLMVDGVLDVFNLGDLAKMTNGDVDYNFVSGISAVIGKVPGVGKAGIMAMVNKAGKTPVGGREGWDRLNVILPEKGTFTLDEANDRIDYYNSLDDRAKEAMNDPAKGYVNAVNEIFGGKATQEGQGKAFDVNTERQHPGDGYERELYDLTIKGAAWLRVDPILKSAVDGKGGVIGERWAVVREAVANARIQLLVKNKIMGTFWERVNMWAVKPLSTAREPATQVTIYYNGKAMVVDLVYFPEGKMVFRECKSGDAVLNKGTQADIYHEIAKDTTRAKVTFSDPEMQARYTDPMADIEVDPVARDKDILPK